MNSPHAFGDVNLSFVKHNRGRNWRSVQFNRECWLMLLGFPVDYWEQEYLDNAVCSFGRVVSWEKDFSKLARLIVKARVLDLESVPQFLILSDAEGFHGESWTVQCEIIQNDLLGGMPPDEDPLPDDQPDPNAPFDFFGHGQVGPGPVEDVQDGIGEGENNQGAGWEPWPENGVEQPNLVLGLEAPLANPELDLNDLPLEDADQPINAGEILNPAAGEVGEEIIMEEAFIEANVLVPNVIEEEFDLNVEIEQIEDFPNAVELPVVPLENFLVEEFPENMLMGDAEMEEGDAQEQDVEILNNQGNIQLGFVEIADSFSMDPGLANY